MAADQLVGAGVDVLAVVCLVILWYVTLRQLAVDLRQRTTLPHDRERQVWRDASHVTPRSPK